MACIGNDINYTTTTTDSTNHTTIYRAPCPQCGYTHVIGWPCVKQPYTITKETAARSTVCVSCGKWYDTAQPHYCQSFTPIQTPPEEPVSDNIDNTLMDRLTAMRDTRDSAARYAQSKNDEASLHEIEAIRLRAQAGMMYREINEGVPMTPDKK